MAKPSKSNKRGAFVEEESFGSSPRVHLMRALFQVVQPYRHWLVIFFLALCATSLFALLRPLARQHLLDEGVLSRHASSATKYGFVLLGLVIFEQIFGF